MGILLQIHNFRAWRLPSWPRQLKKMNFHPDVRPVKIEECVKTHYFCWQNSSRPLTVLPNMQKSSNFEALFKNDVCSCAFSPLPFSTFSPLPFHLNYSLTARSGCHRTFVSTLFLCKKCLKFSSTLQPMGVDSSGGPNFRAYRFVENNPFLASGFGLHVIRCYRSAYGG